MTTTQTQESQVLAALEVFSSATDKDAINRANTWLLDFQHSVGFPSRFGIPFQSS